MNNHTQTTTACQDCGTSTVELLPVVTVTPGPLSEPVPVQVSRHLYCRECEDWRWIDITATPQAQQILAATPVCHDLPAEELLPAVDFFPGLAAQYTRIYQCRFCDRLIRVEVTDEREQDLVWAQVMW